MPHHARTVENESEMVNDVPAEETDFLLRDQKPAPENPSLKNQVEFRRLDLAGPAVEPHQLVLEVWIGDDTEFVNPCLR